MNVTTDVIVGFPTEGEDAFERTLEVVDAGGHHPRPHVLLLAAAGNRRRGARRPREPAGEEAPLAELRGHSEVRSRLHRAAKLGHAPSACSSTRSPTRQCSGYTADYTRCYLPAGAAGRGEVVDVVCEELHADGISCRIPGPAGLS